MDFLNDLGFQAQTWLTHWMMTPGSLRQLFFILAAFLAAFLISRLIVWPRVDPKIDLNQWTLGMLVIVLAKRLATPLVSIFLLWVAHGVAHHFGWPQGWLHIALILLLAWILTRIVVTLFFYALKSRNRTVGVPVGILLWLVVALALTDYLDPTFRLLNDIAVKIDGVRLSLLHFIAGSLILVVFIGLSRAVNESFANWVKTAERGSPSFQVLSVKLFKVGFYTLAVILTMGGLGLDLSNLAWFSGAIGLGLGFGLQKVISNLASGFIILADKSIKPGDVIQVGETYGWVNNLRSRYISVITRDAVEYLIPNEDLITGKVVNWSYSHDLVRIKIPVGIAYGSDLELAMKLMLEAAAAVPRVLAKPEPSCRLMQFGDSSINFQLRIWINDPQNGVGGVKSDVYLEIWRRFQEHGIEIPFPQRVLYHKSMPEISIKKEA
jgi:small-conductance mechanosensitive channel